MLSIGLGCYYYASHLIIHHPQRVQQLKLLLPSSNICNATKIILPFNNNVQHPFKISHRNYSTSETETRTKSKAKAKATFSSSTSQKDDAKKKQERIEARGRTIDYLLRELPLFLGPPFNFPNDSMTRMAKNVQLVTYYPSSNADSSSTSTEPENSQSNDRFHHIHHIFIPGAPQRSPEDPNNLMILLEGKRKLSWLLKAVQILLRTSMSSIGSEWVLTHSHYVEHGSGSSSSNNASTDKNISDRLTAPCLSVRFRWTLKLKSLSLDLHLPQSKSIGKQRNKLKNPNEIGSSHPDLQPNDFSNAMGLQKDGLITFYLDPETGLVRVIRWDSRIYDPVDGVRWSNILDDGEVGKQEQQPSLNTIRVHKRNDEDNELERNNNK